MENLLQEKAGMDKVKHKSRLDAYKSKVTEIPVAAKVHLSVLSTGAQGTGKSFLLMLNHDRYLFNAPEMVQRHIDEVGPQKLSVVDNIFFTSKRDETVGGLIPFLLTNSGLHHQSTLKLHGPPQVGAFLSMINEFADTNVNANLKTEYRGIQHKQYKDRQVTVDYVPLYDSSGLRPICPDSQTSEVNKERSQKRPGKRSEQPGQSEEKTENELSLEDAREIELAKHMVMAYVVHFKELPARVDNIKLAALKVKPGPWVGQLVKGETVTLSDGRVVKPEDVLMSSRESCFVGPLVVLEVPSGDYLDSLGESQELCNLGTQPGKLGPELVVHLTPQAVLDDPRYQAFMNRLPCQHLILNERAGSCNMYSAFRVAVMRNYIHKEMFPMPVGYTHSCQPAESPKPEITYGVYGLQYHIRPHNNRGYNWDSVPKYDRAVALEEVKEKIALNRRALNKNGGNGEDSRYSWDSFLAEYEKFSQLIQSPEKTGIIFDSEYPEITFLGTGSAKPSYKRGTSGILLQMRPDEYILLDCGEGTWQTMLVLYGREKSEHILTNLRAIFISHLHYDHHGGLFSLLKARRQSVQSRGGDVKTDEPRLLLLAPNSYSRWIDLYSKHIEDVSQDVRLCPHSVAISKTNPLHGEETSMIKRQLGLKEYTLSKVWHTYYSAAIIMTHQDGWKLVYSGDTMPCKALIKEGKDCDILIHEATFTDEQFQHAQLKHHSVMSEAIEVGRAMNARYTLLTHFSQRIPDIPPFCDRFTENVGYAFDFMQVRPRNLHLLYHMKPMFESLFGAYIRANIVGSINKSRIDDGEQAIRKTSRNKIYPKFKTLEDSLAYIRGDCEIDQLKGSDTRDSESDSEKNMDNTGGKRKVEDSNIIVKRAR
ncbi:RNZ2-like protein [Mya arenaria]|uniref:ribonuclease Z n=1 Tax=Mya arenaria TaxID=6604 RepID=A0ABY7DPU0_MYAAR|nr:RNZ2-like protein [Mya arenaria]